MYIERKTKYKSIYFMALQNKKIDKTNITNTSEKKNILIKSIKLISNLTLNMVFAKITVEFIIQLLK